RSPQLGREGVREGSGVADAPVLERPALGHAHVLSMAGAQVVLHRVRLVGERLDPGGAALVVVGEGGGGGDVATRLGAGAAAHGRDATDPLPPWRGPPPPYIGQPGPCSRPRTRILAG